MAFRMKRTLPNDTKPPPMRKRRKLNQLFDIDDVEAMSKKAEISPSEALTADEKRIEIAKRLLAATRESIVAHSDDDEIDEKQIHNKLMGKIGQLEGSYRYRMATKLRDYISKHKDIDAKIASFRGHRLSVTCMALDPTKKDRYILTGSKDGSIIKWDLKTGKKLKKVWHAWPLKKNKSKKKVKWGGLRYEDFKKIRPKPVLAVAISPDEKWLVSGGEDCLIRVWNFQTMRFRSTFRGGHSKKVTGLAFSRDSYDNKLLMAEHECNNTLFSTGADRQIRVYDMNEMGFAQPLYGHREAINNIATTNQDRCLTVSDDKTIRYWKLRTQSQLIFNENIHGEGHSDNIDACCMLTPSRFITGSQDGSIALWSTAKKYPLHKLSDAHVSNNKADIVDKNSKLRHWIVSLGAKHNCDVFASGSSDGVIKLFAVKNRNFLHLRSIQIPKCGFVNVMKWSDRGDKLICGIGTEHRLGRWDHMTGAKNGIVIIKLPVNCMDDHIDGDGDGDGKAEEDEIEYTKAKTWDKWNPQERGEYIDEKKTKDIDDDGENVEAFLDENDEIDDEWTSFFGNVFT